MEERRQAVLEGGMAAVADMVMGRFFSPPSLADEPADRRRPARTLLATNPVGYAGCCAAIRDMDLTPSLDAIRVPALIVDGELDTSLPWKGHGEVLAREIAGARVVHLRTAHLSNLEAPRAFTAALFAFLPPGDNVDQGQAARDRGLAIRRAVLGDAHVDGARRGAADQRGVSGSDHALRVG